MSSEFALTDLTADDVKAFRASLAKSQTAFGEMFGISLPGVQKWEKVGAPGYWRYVFAAVNAGLAPWRAETPDVINLHLDEALAALKTSELFVKEVVAEKIDSRRKGQTPSKLYYSRRDLGDGTYSVVCNGHPIPVIIEA